MEGRYIEFADGTTMAGDVGYAGAGLWLYTEETDIPSACRILDNRERTRKIIYHYGEMSETYEGFNRIEFMSVDNGKVKVMMTRSETTGGEEK